jgi:Flp pilus assembly pilin Flp
MRRGSQRAGNESGQSLVEYALIIAIVALGAIIALGFLSGKVNSLFSKAGNSLNNVQAASGPGGGPGGGGGGAPATPGITGGPADGSSGNTAAFTSPSFTFTGDGTQTGFQCRLDGGTFTACTSPQGYSGLGTGGHTFQVQASNGSGTSSPASRNWTVTANPPSAGTLSISCPGSPCSEADTLTASLSGWQNVTSFTYTWEQHSSSGQTCGSSGGWSGIGGNSPTVSGISVNGSSDAVRVTVVGHGSGPDTAPVCASIVVNEVQAPSVSVSVGCGGSCNDGETATASVSVSGVPAPTVTYQWAWNESSGASCSSSSGWNNLGTGSTQVLGNSGSGDSDAIRVIVTATNSAGTATDRDCTSYS